ncbi:MAG: hypothetical protein WCG27_08325 [Pseudomonadota bacterium]
MRLLLLLIFIINLSAHAEDRTFFTILPSDVAVKQGRLKVVGEQIGKWNFNIPDNSETNKTDAVWLKKTDQRTTSNYYISADNTKGDLQFIKYFRHFYNKDDDKTDYMIDIVHYQGNGDVRDITLCDQINTKGPAFHPFCYFIDQKVCQQFYKEFPSANSSDDNEFYKKYNEVNKCQETLSKVGNIFASSGPPQFIKNNFQQFLKDAKVQLQDNDIGTNSRWADKKEGNIFYMAAGLLKLQDLCKRFPSDKVEKTKVKSAEKLPENTVIGQ